MKKDDLRNALKALLGKLLAQGAASLAKLVKSKLLPKAEEKYCKALQVVAEKLTKRAADRVSELAEEKDVKKRTVNLYLLKLMKETFITVASSFTETANFITEHVDFKEIDEPSEETLVALADIPGALDNDGDGCGPDGCEIA